MITRDRLNEIVAELSRDGIADALGDAQTILCVIAIVAQMPKAIILEHLNVAYDDFKGPVEIAIALGQIRRQTLS